MLFEYLDWICYIDKRYRQQYIAEWVKMKENAYKRIIAVFSHSTTSIENKVDPKLKNGISKTINIAVTRTDQKNYSISIKHTLNVSSNFLSSEEMVEKTISHYKELRTTYNASITVNTSDFWDSTLFLLKNKAAGNSFDLINFRNSDTRKKNSFVVFNQCSHSQAVLATRLKYNGRLYCSTCETTFEQATGIQNFYG